MPYEHVFIVMRLTERCVRNRDWPTLLICIFVRALPARFLPCDFNEKKSKMRKELDKHFSDSFVEWVQTEMLQNREKGQVRSEGVYVGVRAWASIMLWVCVRMKMRMCR
jgi:hypothetical protein